LPGSAIRANSQTGNHRLDKQKRKFSTFLRSLVVEMDNREAPTFSEGNIVEWHPAAGVAPVDGFEVLRRGDKNVKCRIVLHLQHSPERFKVIPPLSDMISMREGTRAEVMAAVWQLVKTSAAQDKEDPTIVRPIGGLEKLVPHGAEGLQFHQIPEVATRFLVHPDPVVINYEIDVSKDHTLHPRCFDIPIEIEDPLRSKMATLVQSFEGQAGSDIVKLEDKVGELAYFARDVKQKRDFLEAFA
jgi:SWI/SNF-related matrix-associated actin-dependent regulator of chromatin subfamily D